MFILFDIGGTNTRVAATEDLKKFSKPVKFKTPNNFDEGIKLITETAKRLAGDAKIDMAAGGIRGPLNKEKTELLSEDILTDWVAKPVVEKLSELLDTEVILENDTAVVGMGEAHFGSGQGYEIVVYHTVSTGVGGVRIVGGEIDKASFGFEPGKQIIDSDKTLCPDCESGSLEDMISGSSLERRFKVKPYEIPQDDAVWDQLAHWLGYGLNNTITYWSPDVIVLGGSMIIGDPRIFREDIMRYTKEIIGGLVPCPDIFDAELGDEGGLYGAMALIKQREIYGKNR